ncbi:uncharacterized protein [Ptychodera flava]|uniref:uncharacterized protein isoform X3 n=1 Tax=Ptychodera flava TaxID=63121 RepID=UPI00396A1853
MSSKPQRACKTCLVDLKHHKGPSGHLCRENKDNSFEMDLKSSPNVNLPTPADHLKKTRDTIRTEWLKPDTSEGHNTAWSNLQDLVKSIQKAAFRPGTQKNLKTQLDTYLRFCYKMQRTPFPTCGETLSAFACFLSQTFKSSKSVRNYVSGICTWSKLLGHHSLNLYNIDLRLTLQGLDKSMIALPHPRQPILPQHLLSMHQLIDLNDSKDATIWACITIAFFTFLRKSNMVPLSTNKFSPLEHLTRGNFQFCSQGLLVSTTWSKTRQKHDFKHTIPLALRPNCAVCPVLAYCNMLKLIPAPPSSPAFVLRHHGALRPLTQTQLTSRFQVLITKIGLNPLDYSFHSLRRGGATTASLAGVSDSLIRLQGDWRSMVYKDYIAVPATERFHITESMGSLFQ